MNKRMGLVLVAVLFLGFSMSAAVADDLQALEKKITAGWDKHKSMTAKMTMTLHMGNHATGAGTFEVLNKGGKVLSRMEMKVEMVHKAGDQEMRMEQRITSIVDGEYTYMVMDMMGQKTAMKMNIDPEKSADPKSMFASLRKTTELKLLPDETIDGKKVHVLEATPKEVSAVPIAKEIYYFQQEAGILVKLISYGADGKPIQTMSITDVKFDIDIDPQRFVFKAPPGVQVIDQTGTTP